MKFIAFEKEIPGFDKEKMQQLLKPEAAKIRELQRAGIVREIYFTGETHEAVIILETNTKEKAEKILAELPLVAGNLIRFEIYTLVPYDGFERLFG